MTQSRWLVVTPLSIEAKSLSSVAAAFDADIRVIGPQAASWPLEWPSMPRAIILAGLGGGLDPALRCGDVIVDDRSGLPCGTLRRGPIYTADHLVGTPAEKRALFDSTRTLVVDMENAIVRSRTNQLGLPFVGIRAVCDTANEFLDPKMSGLVDKNGEVRTGAVASALLCRPTLFPRMWRARASARVALRALKGAVTEVLKAANP
jgi:hypothetical protein